MRRAGILALEYHLPADVMTTERLAAEFPEGSIQKVDAKTGIRRRHIAAAEECSSDLAFAAAQKLFASGTCDPAEIDYLLFCTQSPDYFLPTTACILQERLGIPTTAGALDFNQGSTGFVYGLSLAHALVESGQAKRVLLLTGETYSKFIHPRDRSVRTIFGDAGAATLIGAMDSPEPLIGPFVLGTDGSGHTNLIVPAGGMRRPRGPETSIAADDGTGNVRSPENLYMAGTEIFSFTLRIIPPLFEEVLRKAGKSVDQIGAFIFHQANQQMLEHIRKLLKLPTEKFHIYLEDCGNTVSCTIPIALAMAHGERKLPRNGLVMLVSYGVGYSWAATLIRWTV